MEEIQNTRKSPLRRIAVATVAMGAVVAGLGMAPAGADDKVSAEVDVSVEATAAFGDGSSAIFFVSTSGGDAR